MLRVGLTGGIGCGKTTVAAMMRELGCAVLDADALAHALMSPGGSAYEGVVEAFGREILDSQGNIDRQKLGAIVFHDAAKLAQLNAVVHQRVIEVQERRLAEMEREGRTPVAIVEAALLIEAGYHKRLDKLVVVWCRPGQQRERLRERGLTEAQIEQRIAAQMPLDEKRKLADYEVDCSESLERTRNQVEQVVAELRQLAAA